MIRHSLALLAAATFFAPCAQAQTSIVIQGGTLIDGTGRPPVENAVIVIEGNRFKAIGRAGEVTIPAGSQIVDVSGKHILPGFIDGHCHLELFWGETYLHLGFTTCVSIETQQNGPWVLAQKYGTEIGKIRGPRIWATGQALGVRDGEFDPEGSRAWRGYIKVPDAETARAIVRQKKQDGYEAIKITEFLAPDLIPAVTDEAHKLGMGVTGHTWDSITFAKAGVDAVEHIWSVGYTSIRDPEKRNKLAYERTKGRIDAEVAGAQYEVEGFDEVIKALVENKVAFTPTIAKWMRPLSPSADRFWKREQEILGNPQGEISRCRARDHGIHD